jgi:hypothetical protein
MEEGYGLVRWREAEHIFLSDSRETAFQEALQTGRAREYSLIPDERNAVAIDCRFAEVASLEELGTGRTRFEVWLGDKEATERIDFDHAFDLEGKVPEPTF